MDRIPVSSSSIAAAGYDDMSRTLEIEFTNGHTYQYFDVTRHVYETIVGGSISVGQYFNENVRNVYRYARV
jgi:KTSC domain-containing protein